MTRKTIFKKAIEKANANGWGRDDIKINSDLTNESFGIMLVYAIIFSHDFAKALWGKEDMWHKTACTCGGVDFHFGGYDMHHAGCAKISADRGYKFHLAKMVVEKDPIKYLEKFIQN